MIYAYPCEGVYGLGCDPDSKKDVFKLCDLKKRSTEKGLILISGVFEHFEKFHQIELNFPSFLCSIIVSTAALPTPLTAPIPKRIAFWSFTANL